VVCRSSLDFSHEAEIFGEKVGSALSDVLEWKVRTLFGVPFPVFCVGLVGWR